MSIFVVMICGNVSYTHIWKEVSHIDKMRDCVGRLNHVFNKDL